MTHTPLPFRLLPLLPLLLLTLLAGCATPMRIKPSKAPPRLIGLDARQLWPGLGAAPESAARKRAEEALLNLLLPESRHLPAPGGRVVFRDGLEVTVDAGDLPWKPTPEDEYSIAARLNFQGLRHHHRRPGAGVPLIADLHHARVTPADRHYPLEGRVYAVTAVAEVLAPADAGGTGGRVKLRLLDPRNRAAVRLEDGADHPLAADFSAPYALQLTRNNLDKDKLSNLLRPEKMNGRRGVYFMEPLDKDKIPLLMVHGLMSSTLTWRQMTNDLWADPAIRARYQIWHYSYPTGMPFFYSAKAFREDVSAALADARATVGKNLPKMVVVAHSLGGLLTKSMAGRVDNCLWDATFNCPIEHLKLSPEDHRSLHESFMPKRDPRIARVVFIAVPHRGSDLARKFIGKVGVGLMKLPADFLTYYQRVIATNYDHLQPGARNFYSRTGVTSIQDMSDLNPILQAFATIPMGDVPFHTILGSISNTFPTDGVVPVKSGRLEGAQSELIVPGFGHMVNQTPEAIEEVKRILLEHK